MLTVYVINTRESNLIEQYKRRPFSVGQNMTRQRRALQATVGSHIELQKPVPYSGSNPDALSVVTLSLWLGPVLLSIDIILPVIHLELDHMTICGCCQVAVTEKSQYFHYKNNNEPKIT